MKRLQLIVVLLLAALMLTACYTDHDPWPTGGELTSPTATPVATQVSATEPPAPEIQPSPENTQAPGING